jgi:shikimate kinase
MRQQQQGIMTTTNRSEYDSLYIFSSNIIAEDGESLGESMTSHIIFLCGFMGSGKTYYSNQLKLNDKKREWDFIDLDCWIAQSNSIEPENLGEKIREKGWEWFRAQENKFIEILLERKGLSSKFNLVCSLGGGSLNLQILTRIKNSSDAWIVWIDVPFVEIYERIKNDQNRPMVQQKTKKELEQLYQDRAALYSQADLKLKPIELAKFSSPQGLLEKLQESKA